MWEGWVGTGSRRFSGALGWPNGNDVGAAAPAGAAGGVRSGVRTQSEWVSFIPVYRKIRDTHRPRMLSLCYSVRNSTLQTHPSMLPKSASGPQNHPSANVALFDLALATAGVTRGQSCFPDRAPMSLLSIRREEGAASDLGSEGGTGVERRRSTMV